jgi:hypothetical protein
MKAIRTRYLPATNTKPSRIKADDYCGNSVTISFPYEFSGEEAFKSAAIALCEKMGWSKELIGGGTDTGYVFCFINQ